MKKDLTELVFILDRSGSMQGLENDTIGGFNSLIEKQKNEQGEAIVSTILFDDEYKQLHDRVNITDVKLMTRDDYFVGGCTALLDAVGTAVNNIINIRKKTPKSTHPGKTVFVITTDGMENASVEFNYKKIQTLIKNQQEKYGWEFIFLGANIDVAAEAQRLGVRRDRSVAFHCDSIGIDACYEAVGEAISACRMEKDLSDRAWAKKAEEDFFNRFGKKIFDDEN